MEIFDKSVKKEKFVTNIFFQLNFEWNSNKLLKMITAVKIDIKKQEIRKTGNCIL